MRPIAHFRKALELSPDDVAACYTVGVSLQTMGEALDLARQPIRTALVEKLKARLWLYDVGETPYRDTRQRAVK